MHISPAPSSHCLFTFIAAPSLEETLVDWLLANASQYGFTSGPMNGHSAQHGGLSLAEQVAGRRKQVRFDVHLESVDLPPLLNKLENDFAHTGLHYWVTPLWVSGHLS